MINVLIVDDEVIAVKSTKKLIESEFDQTTIDVAFSGFDAVKMSKNKNIDIVIMDISMPEMDGLTTMQKIKEHCPFAKFIIISAHSEFEFARKAIERGAVNYLLKPFNHKEFINIIQGIFDEIYIDFKEREVQSKNEQSIETLENHVRKELFNSILTGRTLYNNLDIYSDVIKINLSCLSVMFINVINNMEQPQLKDQALEDICSALQNVSDCIAQVVAADRVMLLINKKPNEQDIYFYIKEKIVSLLSKKNYANDLQIRYGVGSECEDIEELHQSCLEASYALQRAENDEIQFYSIEPQSNYLTAFQAAKTIISYIISNEIDKLSEKMIYDLLYNFYEQAIYQRGNVRAKLIAFVLEFILQINDLSSEFSNLCKNKCVDMIVLSINECSDEQLLKNITNFVWNICEELKCLGMHSADIITQNAVEFMNNNYDKDITLSVTAENVHVSNFYLSRVFKIKMGKGFAEYLTQIRIKNAKKLLEETDKTIKQVASDVGYANQTYFGKIFKDKVGISPGEFRIKVKKQI